MCRHVCLHICSLLLTLCSVCVCVCVCVCLLQHAEFVSIELLVKSEQLYWEAPNLNQSKWTAVSGQRGQTDKGTICSADITHRCRTGSLHLYHQIASVYVAELPVIPVSDDSTRQLNRQSLYKCDAWWVSRVDLKCFANSQSSKVLTVKTNLWFEFDMVKLNFVLQIQRIIWNGYSPFHKSEIEVFQLKTYSRVKA